MLSYYSFLTIHYSLFFSVIHSSDCYHIPATGYRLYSTGALNVVGTEGGCWCSSSYAAGNHDAGDFWSHTSNVNPLNNGNRSNGLPVRCVQHLQAAFTVRAAPANETPRTESDRGVYANL